MLAVTAGAMAILNWIVIAVKNRWSISDIPEHWGQAGDFFGGILNPVVALAALFVLSRGTRYQREELKLAREELRLTRAELILSRNHVQTEDKKNELYRLIVSAEGQIIAVLRVRTVWNPRRHDKKEAQLRDALKFAQADEWEDAYIVQSETLWVAFKSYIADELLPAIDHLYSLIDQYEALASADSAVVKHYRSAFHMEYGRAVEIDLSNRT